jgi:hypothetical protein
LEVRPEILKLPQGVPTAPLVVNLQLSIAVDNRVPDRIIDAGEQFRIGRISHYYSNGVELNSYKGKSVPERDRSYSTGAK